LAASGGSIWRRIILISASVVSVPIFLLMLVAFADSNK
jgi:hypothetical protein